jgi:hypothetical protein
MKRQILILAIASFTTFVSCSKENMTIIKDCTGSYLRLGGKDYHICNIEATESFDGGTEVEASFERISDCQTKPPTECEMYHKNEGWVNVTDIE